MFTRKTITVLGGGHVGGTLVELLLNSGQFPHLKLHKVAVADPSKQRKAEIRLSSGELCWRPLIIPEALLTTDCEAAALDPEVDIVIDATAAATPDLLLRAMAVGKDVVSANKKMVARDGERLIAAAKAAGVCFLYEATVMAKVPILNIGRLISELQVQRVLAIVSGTVAFISRAMRNENTAYEIALAEAQRLGYAEKDPTVDVGAYDSAAKARILA